MERRKSFTNSAGEQVELGAGFYIVWDEKAKCVYFKDQRGRDLRWSDAERKKYLPFLATDDDFTLFVTFIAEMLGLQAVRMTSVRRPAYQFTAPH
jgi:hypothetical protein